MQSYSVTIQMKATEQYFPVVLFILLYKMVLTFGSVQWIKPYSLTNNNNNNNHNLFEMNNVYNYMDMNMFET